MKDTVWIIEVKRAGKWVPLSTAWHKSREIARSYQKHAGGETRVVPFDRRKGRK